MGVLTAPASSVSTETGAAAEVALSAGVGGKLVVAGLVAAGGRLMLDRERSSKSMFRRMQLMLFCPKSRTPADTVLRDVFGAFAHKDSAVVAVLL